MRSRLSGVHFLILLFTGYFLVLFLMQLTWLRYLCLNRVIALNFSNIAFSHLK